MKPFEHKIYEEKIYFSQVKTFYESYLMAEELFLFAVHEKPFPAATTANCERDFLPLLV